MNWEAIGAIGEIIGAFAVVVTLFFLAMQLRQNAKSVDESNRLQRAAAIDRHNDTISRWRGRLMTNSELAEIWMKARAGEQLTKVEQLRVHNCCIDFANTQRAKYARAKLVGEPGLCAIAVNSVASEIIESVWFTDTWRTTKKWMEHVSPEFMAEVEAEIAARQAGTGTGLHSMHDVDENAD